MHTQHLHWHYNSRYPAFSSGNNMRVNLFVFNPSPGASPMRIRIACCQSLQATGIKCITVYPAILNQSAPVIGKANRILERELVYDTYARVERVHDGR